MDDLRHYYLQAMGITPWERRESASTIDAQPAVTEVKASAADDSTTPSEQWSQLFAEVSQCQRCALHKTRRQAVFGVGSPQADLMIVGEAPGAVEDQRGEPFVGPAGKLLDAMLQTIDLQRRSIFISNVLKCRPPQNRDPSAEEVSCCTPFLERQVALLQPKLMLAVGRVAAHYLLGVSTPMYKLRGQRFQFGAAQIPLIVTYHPAYLLRNPSDKGKAYQDLLLTKRLLDSL